MMAGRCFCRGLEIGFYHKCAVCTSLQVMICMVHKSVMTYHEVNAPFRSTKRNPWRLKNQLLLKNRSSKEIYYA